MANKKLYVDYEKSIVLDCVATGEYARSQDIPILQHGTKPTWDIQIVTESTGTYANSALNDATAWRASVDFDFSHTYIASALTAGFSGAVTSLTVDGVAAGSTIPEAGIIRLTNGSGNYDDVPYSSWSLNSSTYTFVVDATLTYTYLENDVASIENTAPMCRTLNAGIVSTGSATGLIKVTLDTNTSTFEQALESANVSTGLLPCFFELVGLDVSSNSIHSIMIPINAKAAVDHIGSVVPAPATNIYTKAEADNLFPTKTTVNVTSGKVLTVEKSMTLTSSDDTSVITMPAGTKTLAAIDGTIAKATNLVGGNGTTLLGAMPYQSNVDTTTLLAPNTSTTKKFLSQTGDATNGAAPAWAVVAVGDLPAGGAWSLSSNLNIDSNTLVIDQANNRVGVGTASPAGLLEVNGAGGILVRQNRTSVGITDGVEFSMGTSDGATATIQPYLDNTTSRATSLLLQTYNGAGMNSNQLVVHSNGKVGVNTASPADTLDVNGNIVCAASGTGVKLPAASGNADANTLDCYCEGTWTPTLIGAGGGAQTLATAAGVYTRIGRIVFCQIIMTWTDLTTPGGASGSLKVSLPFTSASTSPHAIGACLSDAALDTPAGTVSVYALHVANTDFTYIYFGKDAAAAEPATDAHLLANGALHITLFFRVS